MSESFLTRREILKTAAVIGASAALGQAQNAPTTLPKPMIGIQMPVAPLVQAGTEKVLDDIQARAGVNTLFPFIYTHVNTWAGLPARGFRGGNFAIPHMQYYRETNLTFEDMRAPDLGDVDVMARTIESAKKRGIKTFAWILEDNNAAPVEHWKAFYEVDFHGRPVEAHPGGACYNNPLYRGFILGLVEDYSRSYAIDGVMWSSERQGGLWNALGAWHHGDRADPGRATCFCEHCVAKAKQQVINVERAKEGFAQLETFVRAGRAHQKPRDGYFVSFMRILLDYPELLQWERLWITSRFDFMTDVRNKVKSVKPNLPVGWHIWHNVSFSPFHRAEMDYSKIATFSDFIKPVLYSNVAGERIKSFVDSVSQNVFGDLPPAQALDMVYKMLGYENEAAYDTIFATGLSPDYVRRETRRCVDQVSDKNVQVWPGIDIDVPVPRGASQCTPESVKQTVLAAFRGGASGVVLSRSYSEMKPENLSGAGAALQELGLM